MAEEKKSRTVNPFVKATREAAKARADYELTDMRFNRIANLYSKAQTDRAAARSLFEKAMERVYAFDKEKTGSTSAKA